MSTVRTGAAIYKWSTPPADHIKNPCDGALVVRQASPSLRIRLADGGMWLGKAFDGPA
jgi:hypothetical protein